MLLQTPEYQAAHRRVVYLWGKASQYPCAHCGGAAHHWAYDWTDPSSREDYSHFPEFYMPLCRSCHRRYDATGCYPVIAKVRRYTPGDEPFLEPFFIPPICAPRIRRSPAPTRPQTEAEWDQWAAARV
jgi:hypothetical protein